MITREAAEAAVTEHGSHAAAARALGCGKTTIHDALQRPKQKGAAATAATKTKTAAASAKTEAKIGRPISDFRAQYDKDYIVPHKIDAALKALGASWEYEVQFARLAGVSLADMGHYRDRYADYIVVLGRDSRRAWAGTRATAKQMRDML